MSRLGPLVLTLACAAPPDPAEDRARYRAALESGACDTVVDPALRDDCYVVAAERGAAVCEQVEAKPAASECWFRLAESKADASLCPKAGTFAEQCALHVLSQGFFRWPEVRGAKPGQLEAEVAARIVGSGLDVHDMRPWSAWYRFVLGGLQPFDRSGCADVTDPERREACQRTGVAVYHDLLNQSRDTGTYPCDGGPLPPRLQTTPDPELDAVRAARSDLCPR